MNNSVKQKMQRALRHVTPGHIIRKRITKQTMQRFAERVGLIYFGYVDQHDDDHRLVRGHTVSHTHDDNHLCVGTIQDYDVTVLLRNDMLRIKQKNSHQYKNQHCHWLIVTVDLHTSRALPHMYIGRTHSESIYQATYTTLKSLVLGSLAQYPPEFLQEYAVYGTATHAIEIESIITPEVATALTSHFSKTSIELERNTLFLYLESEHPTQAQLEKLVTNAVWLAGVIDSRMQ